MLWATIAHIGTAFFGNILGNASNGLKILTGISTAAMTIASVWNVHFEAELERVHAHFGK